MIHDYGYSRVVTRSDQLREDLRFMRNTFVLIDKQTKWAIVRGLRHRRALKYYEAVRIGGGRYVQVMPNE